MTSGLNAILLTGLGTVIITTAGAILTMLPLDSLVVDYRLDSYLPEKKYFQLMS